MTIRIDHHIDCLATKRLNSGCLGIFYHCAVIFTKKRGVVFPLSYGENHIRGKNSIHAEMNVIDKLPFRKSNRLLKVSLLVLRVTKNGSYTISKPCLHCIEKMNSAILKNYKIINVYFTNKEGEIEKSSLKNLNNDPIKHISKWNRENNRTFKYD